MGLARVLPRPLTIALAAVAVICGMGMPASAGAVAGGWLVSWSSHPWAVSVGSDICGGVLVAPDRVLTSAGCASDTYPSLREEIRVGDARRHVTAVAMQREWVRQRLDPSSTCADVDVRCTPDIALLRLDRPIRGVPIPRLSIARAGQPAFVFGHGTTSIDDDPTNPARLRAALLQVRSDAVCHRHFTTRADRAILAPQRTVCTIDPRRPYDAGFCIGDGGAPLLAFTGGALRLLGVASWSRGCGAGGWPSVFAEVAPYRRFILARSPVWRPEDLGDPTITGVGAVGATLTCNPPRFTNGPDHVIFVFRTVSGPIFLQRGAAAGYVVRDADRGQAITCDVFAVNAGGFARANTLTGIGIRGPTAASSSDRRRRRVSRPAPRMPRGRTARPTAGGRPGPWPAPASPPSRAPVADRTGSSAGREPGQGRAPRGSPNRSPRRPL